MTCTPLASLAHQGDAARVRVDARLVAVWCEQQSPSRPYSAAKTIAMANAFGTTSPGRLPSEVLIT